MEGTTDRGNGLKCNFKLVVHKSKMIRRGISKKAKLNSGYLNNNYFLKLKMSRNQYKVRKEGRKKWINKAKNTKEKVKVKEK